LYAPCFAGGDARADERPPIDADEAFILDVVGRDAVPPSRTAALPEH